MTERFIPARVHVREKAEWQRFGDRYGVKWTPTILVVDPSGIERHRIEGFLPADDLMGQLALGIGHAAFAKQEFGAAERQLRDVVAEYPATDAAPEALYWAGVARYKATNDGAALAQTAADFTRQYQDSTWAKKSSVWRK